MFVNTNIYSVSDFPVNINLQYLPNPKQPVAFSPHIQSSIEILSPACGSMIVTVDNRDVPLDEGDIIIVNPMELHSGRCNEALSGVDYFCLHFEPSFYINSLPPEAARRLRRILDGKAHFHTVIPAKSDAARTMKKIFIRGAIDNMSIRALDSQCRTVAGVYKVLTLLLCDWWADGPGLAHRTFEFVRKVIEYAENNLASGSLTTADVSRALSYSESYFCRRFREAFGTNFADWYLKFRIEHACQMGAEPGLTIGEIAARSGFSDYAYFSRTFRRCMGVSPREYFTSGCRKKR